MTMREGTLASLRQLRDCGVVRFRFQSDEMSELNARGLAKASYVSARGYCFDWRLTSAGKRAVEALGI